MTDAGTEGIPTHAPAGARQGGPSPGGFVPEIWQIQLYISGRTPKALVALENLKAICERHLSGRCAIEVIDLRQTPERAILDQIVAIPTSIFDRPFPGKRIVGDLSDTGKVLAALGLGA